MSRIDQLIAELCPDGVEVRNLYDVCSYQRGKTITAKQAMPGDVPVVAGGQKPAYFHNESNRVGTTITVAGSGAYAGHVMLWDVPIWVSDAFTVAPIDDSVMSTRYVYQFLKSKQDKLYNMKKGSGVPHVHGQDLKSLRIPVPPVAVQEEIVRILDTFSQLEAELEARRKQYAFYRDQLLTFATDVRHAPLSELCAISRGRVISKPYMAQHPGEYPVYSSQTQDDGVLGTIDSYDYDGEFLTWTTDGANAGSVFHRKGKFSITNVCGLLDVKSDETTLRYLYYWLQYDAKRHVSAGMGNPKLMSNAMARISVPVPSLEVQQRIVEVLDNFEAICADLNIGLPAELEARRKQYEYYRDSLLTFLDTGGSLIASEQASKQASKQAS